MSPAFVQRTMLIIPEADGTGIRVGAGSDQLYHLAPREAFVRRTAETSCGKCQQRAHHRIRASSADSSFLHPKYVTLLSSSGSIPRRRSLHLLMVALPPSLSPKTLPHRRRNAGALLLSNNPG